MEKIPNVVFDTQVYLRALINPYSACGQLTFDLTNDYVPYVAEQIESEVLDVLNRPKIRAKFPKLPTIELPLLRSGYKRQNASKSLSKT